MLALDSLGTFRCLLHSPFRENARIPWIPSFPNPGTGFFGIPVFRVALVDVMPDKGVHGYRFFTKKPLISQGEQLYRARKQRTFPQIAIEISLVISYSFR